jgi:hypothetical protein
MLKGFLASIFSLVLLAASFGAAAVNVTVNDGCGKSVTGATGATNTVDSSGNMTLNQFAAPYAAGVGQCDTAAADGKPRCTLSASQTVVAPAATVTFFAKCTSTPATYTWLDPAGFPPLDPVLNPDPTHSNSIIVTFANAGSYTYSVAATNGTGTGPASGQVTVLVGDTGLKPACIVTASPASILRNQQATLQATCNPEPASYTWTSDAGAPTVTGPLSEPTFTNIGTFTYKVQGVSGVGSGPWVSATVNVADPPSSGTPVYRMSRTSISNAALAFPDGTTPTDFLVVFFASTNVQSPPAGWTQYGSYVFAGSTTRLYIYGRVAGTDTSVTVNNRSGGATIIAAYQNASAVGAIGTFVESSSSATSLSLNAITPQSANGLVLGFVGDRDTAGPTPPATFTSRSATGGSIASINLSERAFGSTSSTGPQVWSQAATLPAAGVLIEILP